MFDVIDKPQILRSKENSTNRILVEFDRVAHFNALITEDWCPLAQRLEVAKEKTKKMQVVVLCETEEEALNTAKYHFFMTGSNFNIVSNNPNK